MNKLQNFLLSSVLVMSCTFSLAYAPVVDDSENFAVNTSSGPDEQQALAHDDQSSAYFSAPRSEASTNDGSGQEIAKLLNQIQDLKQNVQELRGLIDAQNHTIETLKNQQLTLYKDLDDRLSAINASPSKQVATRPIPTKPDVQPIKPSTQADISSVSQAQNPADEQISYMAAYDFIEKKQFKKAELALQEFVQRYPQSGYAPNAEYWLGELYLQNKNYSSAMAHFENVVNNFPSSNKHAASLYKLGVALAANGQMNDAKQKYVAVIQQYPDSDTAKLAQTQLNKL
jgi:tol-pal system protein YbgF